MIRVPLDKENIARFCGGRGIRKMFLFGSVLRDDFGPASDVDVLLEFEENSGITFENRVEIMDKLSALFGRQVDLVDKRSLRNPFRRQAILSTAELIYAA